MAEQLQALMRAKQAQNSCLLLALHTFFGIFCCLYEPVSDIQLHSRNANNYISDTIKFNKPRVILFSPHPQPSLLYKSLAFSNQDLTDFAFFSTDEASEEAVEFLQHFKMSQRAKKLLVFKEYPIPSAMIEVCEDVDSFL